VPFLSALDVVYDDALYKSTFSLLYLLTSARGSHRVSCAEPPQNNEGENTVK